jgi:lysozyme
VYKKEKGLMKEESRMYDREKLKEMLIREEGLKLKPYRDPVSGKLTIGVGRNLEDVGISEDEAMYLLENDIRRAEETAGHCCAAHGVLFENLPEEAQLVLVDMAFNMGYRLKSFRRMFTALRRGDFEEAAKEMLDSKWARQVGRRAENLAEIMKNCAR